jgi:hypothetical protein
MKLMDNDRCNGIFLASIISGSQPSGSAVPAATTRERQIIVLF